MGKGNEFFTREEIDHFQVKRNIISLYKAFLIILEDLEAEHAQHFDKLYEAFPDHQDTISQADYFTEDKMSYLRKKVLDAGNDCVRNLIGENYDNQNR
jgi:hypothetical protein